MSGVEIIGVGLGAAALLPPLMSGGYEHVFKPLCDYKNAPRVVRDFEAFGVDLHRGKLQIDIAAAREAFALPWVDDSTKTALLHSLQALDQEIQAVAPVLQDLRDSNGAPRSSFLHAHSRRRARDALAKLRQRQEECETLLRLVETRKRLVSDVPVLPRDKFRLFKDREVVRVPGRTDVFVGEAEHKDFTSVGGFLVGSQFDGPRPTEIHVLVEQKPNTPFKDDLAGNAKFMAEWKQTVEKIAYKLKHFSPAPCILKCLGYIDDPFQGLQLIFRIPSSLRLKSAITLAEKIESTRRRGEFPSMASRLRICERVAHGVWALQASRMVHKNLRADSVLLFENVVMVDEDAGEDDVPRPTWEAFFIGWDTLRGSASVSSRAHGTGLMQRFYTHPQRARSRKPSYHYGHDIYSLAVVLLEILFWVTFVVASDDEERLSELYIRSARSRLDSSGHPASLSRPSLTDPETIQLTLSWIAKWCIPDLEGQASDVRERRYVGRVGAFVETGLNCIEEGLPPRIKADDWGKDHGRVALAFLDAIRRTFEGEDISQPESPRSPRSPTSPRSP